MNKKFKINFQGTSDTNLEINKKFRINLLDYVFDRYFFSRNFLIKVVFTLVEEIIHKYNDASVSIKNNITNVGIKLDLKSSSNFIVSANILENTIRLKKYIQSFFKNKLKIFANLSVNVSPYINNVSVEQSLFGRATYVFLGSFNFLSVFDFSGPTERPLVGDIDNLIIHSNTGNSMDFTYYEL